MPHIKRLLCLTVMIALVCLAAAALAETACVVTPGGPLNMRKSASAKAGLVGSVPNRTLVEVNELSGDWAKITYQKRTGYVKTEYLLLSSALAGKTVYPDGDGALVYAAPDRDAPLLAAVNGDTPLSVTAVEEGWAVADLAGTAGYVPLEALSLQRTAPSGSLGWIPEPGRTVQACALRRAGTETADLPAGTAVTVCRLEADGETCLAETPLGWGYLPRAAVCLDAYADADVRLAGISAAEAASLAVDALKKEDKGFEKQRLYGAVALYGDAAYCCGFFNDEDQHLYSALVDAAGRVIKVSAYAGFATPQPKEVPLLPAGEVALTLSAETLAVGEVLDISVAAWTAHQCQYTLSREGETVAAGAPGGHFAASWRPREEGAYTLTVTVADETGRTETARAEVSVTGAGAETPLPVYSQKDGWWLNRPYRQSTLDHSGCAIFALSHALQRMGRTGADTLPGQLARTYALCLTPEGTNNERLIREAAADYGFSTQGRLIVSEKQIAALLREGAMFSFSVARGHIALISGLSEDGTMVRVVDSAPFATFDRIVGDSLYYRMRSGSFRAAVRMEDLPGARWYFETDDYGGLEYWMRLSYAARRGVRLIQPGKL